MAATTEITAGRETVSGQVYEHGRPKGWIRGWRPQTKTRKVLDQVSEILVDYSAQTPLTIRQIFYVLVARYLFEKTEKAATSLYEMLATARRARWLDWEQVRDDGVMHLAPHRRFAGERAFFHWLGTSGSTTSSSTRRSASRSLSRSGPRRPA